MRVLLFAGLAEACGRRQLELDPAPQSVAELWAEIRKQFPQLDWTGVRVAVEQQYVDAQHRLRGDEEVALIPPVSGG